MNKTLLIKTVQAFVITCVIFFIIYPKQWISKGGEVVNFVTYKFINKQVGEHYFKQHKIDEFNRFKQDYDKYKTLDSIDSNNFKVLYESKKDYNCYEVLYFSKELNDSIMLYKFIRYVEGPYRNLDESDVICVDLNGKIHSFTADQRIYPFSSRRNEH